jgi:FAD/FMN-containing dehydrogenase
VHDLDGLGAALDGDLLTPASPGYDAARLPALARFWDVRPRAVVRCASARDVARTIGYARDTGTHVVPRGGGHCFAGRSSTEGVVLDLSRLDAITVGPDERARVGAGACLARVYDVLHEHGRTVPAGCGPTVGIAGLTLGGGLGLLGRAYGLTCDALVGARVVLADGRVVGCDTDRDPELFWALRGAGGGQFGVVTSLTFATVPEPRATRFEVCWPDAAADAVIAAWQHWAPDAPDEITANLTVVARPGRPLRVALFGACLRGPDATSRLLDELVAASGTRAEIRLRHGLAVRELKRSFAGDPTGSGAQVTASRSEFFACPLPAAVITALLDQLTAGPNGRCELNFTAMGGAYNRASVEATAFAHRGERFLLEHLARDDPQWADRSWAIAHPHGSGRVYPNFPDPQLDSWAAAYHGDNLPRLAAAKQSYDPGRLFRFPQAIWPEPAGETSVPAGAARGDRMGRPPRRALPRDESATPDPSIPVIRGGALWAR